MQPCKKASEYRFPERFYTEFIDYVGGKRLPLDKEQVDRVVQEYFALRGWDEKAQVKKETIERLDIIRDSH